MLNSGAAHALDPNQQAVAYLMYEGQGTRMPRDGLKLIVAKGLGDDSMFRSGGDTPFD